MSYIALLVFPALMAFAACSDLLTMRISNRLVLATVLAFVALALLAGMPLATIGMHFAAAALVLAVTFACFAAGWIGGGDAKFAAATVLWFGFTPLALTYLLYASVLGGVLTLVIILARRAMLPAPLLQIGWIRRLHNEKTGIPYGIALAGAAMIVYPMTDIFRHFAA